MKRNEIQIIRIRQSKQWPGSGHERWRLVVLPIEGPERPLQARNCKRSPEAWADRAFCLSTGKVRGPDSSSQRQPGRELKLLIQKTGNQASGKVLDRAKGRIATSIIKTHPESFGILLIKAVQPGLQIIFRHIRAQIHLTAAVSRPAVLRCHGRKICGRTVVIGPVEVIERRDGEQHLRVECVYP